MHAAAQFNTLQPVDEQRADRPSSRRATASPFWRGCCRACAASAGGDGARLIELAAQDVVPVGTHVLDVQGAADQRAQVGCCALARTLVSPRSRMRGASSASGQRRDRWPACRCSAPRSAGRTRGTAGVEHIGGIATPTFTAGAERRTGRRYGIEQPSAATLDPVLAPATRGSAGHRRMSCRRPSGRQRRGDTGG